MKRKWTAIMLALAFCLSFHPLMVNAIQAKAETIKTPAAAVSEMTWGVNLADLYMADISRPQGFATGYFANAPFSFALCFWNVVFVSYDSREAQKNVIKVSVPLPDYSKGDKIADYVGGLFAASIWTRVPNQTFKLSLKNSRIVQKGGRSIALTFLNGTYNITPKDPEDSGFFSYTLKFDKSKLPKPSENLNGARFETPITVIDASFRSQKAKVDYFYALDRFKMDPKKLTDVFLKQGVNVIRLPVTWTPFVDDETFKIDEAWLKAVQSEVDYILSKGAYCILNMQMDYLQRSYVGDHWETLWMYDEYKDYVDKRFAAIWKQIAEYFEDYSQKLIFEPLNEPTMEWYEGCPNDWFEKQIQRVNELNGLFVDTVRKTGGKNKTRLLCLAVADYNKYEQLLSMVLPKDDYLIAQVHCYGILEGDPNAGENAAKVDYKANTDAVFKAISAFTERTGIPVIIGEVGVTHREKESVLLPRVKYFFAQAKKHGVPCLWWEDFFYAEDNSQYWLYNKEKKKWGRPQIVSAIKKAVGVDGAKQ